MQKMDKYMVTTSLNKGLNFTFLKRNLPPNVIILVTTNICCCFLLS